jgi:hypothetical protein
MALETEDRIAALHGTIGWKPRQGKAVNCEEKNPGFDPRLEAGITFKLAPQAPGAPNCSPIQESPVLTPMNSA